MKKKIDIPYLICLILVFFVGVLLYKVLSSEVEHLGNIICGVIIGKIIYHLYKAYKSHKRHKEHEEG